MAREVRLIFWLSAIVAIVSLLGCQSHRLRSPSQFAGGDSKSGKNKISYYGCPACHEIAGIQTATGRVGPSLIHISQQTYLAGELPNTPQNMALWIQKPRDIEAHTAMPNMAVSDQDARDITAYLYTTN